MDKIPGRGNEGKLEELVLSHVPLGDEMDAYERLLGDAMRGDQTLFAREDSVEADWRIVEPALDGKIPVQWYEAGTWGPPGYDRLICPPGGWCNPVV